MQDGTQTRQLPLSVHFCDLVQATTSQSQSEVKLNNAMAHGVNISGIVW
jgi:hypothetical protein